MRNPYNANDDRAKNSLKSKSLATALANTENVTQIAFPIVGVGASAGGLEEFTQLLSHLPENTGMGFVLVQHLVPDQPSQLTSLFAGTTKMPVREVKNDMAIRPDHTCGSLYRQTGKALFSVVGLGI